MKKIDLPKKLAVFPLSNFIIFPKTTVPLNIFEPRYIDMVNDSMSSNKFVGMIQPKIQKEVNQNYEPELHQIGCMGKITSFKETQESRYLIELKGVIRFNSEKNQMEGFTGKTDIDNNIINIERTFSKFINLNNNT